MASSFYATDIIDATEGSSDDTAAHGGNPLANDGPALDWWLHALVQYKAFNFQGSQGAYWYIGQMAHLVEDMSVPAHAFDILHAPLPTHDNFEEDAYFHYSQDSVVLQTIANVYPSDYKDYNKWNTRDVINNDLITPPPGLTWNDYYVNNSYGAYTFPDNWPIAPEEQNLLASMLTTARNYTAGALFEASKKLPPLVKDLEIAPVSEPIPIINPQTGNTISFKILENRKKAVKIFITIDSPTGDPIISADYGTGKSFDLSSGTELPWEGIYSINWDGKLANGQYPSSGQHDLHVRIEDDDGNSSDDTLHHFTIDTTPPTISGVTIAPDPAFINPTLTAASTDTVSKIAEAEYYLDSADPGEGNGASLSAQDGTFDELTEDLTGTINISGLSNGQHTAHVRAKDAAGNWSQAISKTFTVGDNIPPVVTLIDFKTTDIKETRYYNCSDQYLYSIITPGSMRAAWKGRDNVTPPEKITFATMLEPVDAGYSGFGYSTSTVRSINEEGSYVFYLKAQDEADNESSPIGRAFTIGRQIINVKVGPGCDLNPDESYAIYTSPQNVEIQVDLDGDVAILGNGFVYEASQFLSQLKIPFNIRDPKALLTSKRYPVLFIPTAGLDGLENSPTFRNDLAQYVSEGGTIICMTQPHGYHFQALPGGSLTGVGYTEDISCWVSAFGQSHDHPIFYGLHPLTWIGSQDYMLDTYADGYFLKWSPETKVLATRLYNNMPGIVEYGYGQGRV